MYVAAGQGFAHWTEATEDDRFFTCLPFFHANAQYYSTMGALAAGARWWSPSGSAPLAFGSRCAGRRYGGELYRDDDAVLSKQPPSELDPGNRVRLFYGSPAFAPEFLQDFQDRFGTDIIVGSV